MVNRCCILDVTCALTWHVAHHWLASSNEESERNSVSSQRDVYHCSGADSVCKLNEVNRFTWHLVFDTSGVKLDSDGGRGHQNDATTVHDGHGRGLTRQNGELQAELAPSRHDIAALRQEMRAHQRGPQTTGVCVDTRLLGKPGDLSSAQDAWRDWSSVFKGYAGAAPRLQKLMSEAAKAPSPIPNAPRSWRKTIGLRRRSSDRVSGG